MSGEDLEQTVRRLRSVELRHAIRGVDPEQVRELLDEAADSLAGAVREQNELRSELERLRAADEKDAIANALVTATRASEAIVAEARDTAAKIVAEADARASVLLERTASLVEERERETAAIRAQFDRELAAAKSAVGEEHESVRAEAAAALADARRELDRLEAEAERRRSVATDTQRQVAEIVQAGIDKLEALDADMSRAAGTDLLADLRPAQNAQPVQAPAPHADSPATDLASSGSG